MSVWLTLFGMGIVTYVSRLSLIASIGRIGVPPLMQRALRFVPPAVLTAIIFPELVRPAGTLDVSLWNLRLVAGIVAVVVAWRSKSVVLTIAVGMAALWALMAITG